MVASQGGSARTIFCRRVWIAALLLLVVVFAVSCSLVHAQDDDSTTVAASAEEAGSAESSGSSDSSPHSDLPPKETRRSASDNKDDWGSFYDPNNVFCGKFDCYKILGFDHETWGSDPPSLKAITKSYRNLSRKWHPDKNKAKGARERFVVSTIPRAFLIKSTYSRPHDFSISSFYSPSAGHLQSIRNPHQL
jgi:DnaJ family protein C protein 25